MSLIKDTKKGKKSCSATELNCPGKEDFFIIVKLTARDLYYLSSHFVSSELFFKFYVFLRRRIVAFWNLKLGFSPNFSNCLSSSHFSKLFIISYLPENFAALDLNVGNQQHSWMYKYANLTDPSNFMRGICCELFLVSCFKKLADF